MERNVISWLVKVTDEDTLARIWCDFNSWEWPKDLPSKFKPPWWDGTTVPHRNTQDRKLGYMGPPMDYIKDKVKKEMIDKWWMKPSSKTTTKQ